VESHVIFTQGKRWQKDVENEWFPLENDPQMVDFPQL
jgi:hypothetical protein